MGFLIVFDITNEDSFNQVRDWVSLLQQYAYSSEPDMILVGNKVDLEEYRAVPYERAERLAKEFG